MISKYKKDEGYLIDGEVNVNDLPLNKYKRKIWLLFEYPHSSIFARIIAIISVFIISISIVLFCAETMPGIKSRRAINELSHAQSHSTNLPTTTDITHTTVLNSIQSTLTPSLLILVSCFLLETLFQFLNLILLLKRMNFLSLKQFV